ncbi:MAG TPA: hypothetical protein VHC69_16485 [Polyangiaceae bacterium]|nr:hypothetical protein [Polyangiaceae bacterium]
MPTDDEKDDEESAASPGIPAELLKSYLAFAKRALARNWLASAAILVAVVAMTIVVAKYWPRTYHCEAKLMVEINDALIGHGGTQNNVASLRGAANVISRHENLEAIIKHTDLVHLSASRRPPILKLKDRIIEKVFGKISDEDAARAMVWTLESKLFADATDQQLVIGADWGDPETATVIVQNALDNYLESRHTAEISSIAEYISILEGHANDLKNEVESLAKQVQDARMQRRAEVKAKLKEDHAVEAPPPVVRRPVVQIQRESEDSIATRAAIEAKKQAITDLEGVRQRKLLELQSKYDELKTRYTPAHPVMEDLQQQINALSHEAPQVAALKSELHDLEQQEEKRTTNIAVGGAIAGSGVRSGALPTDVQLPDDVVNLLNSARPDDDTDPALGAQFGYAVAKFSTLRTQISEARIELDTAQAAFTRRYKVVSAPEVPNKPIKPKVPVIIGVGVFLGLALGALMGIGLELRRGKIVERWQIQELALPVLAELQFPPSSSNE